MANDDHLVFDHPRVKGWIIYAYESVSGTAHNDALVWYEKGGDNLSLEMVRDPDNKHDKNAIQVIGVSGSRRWLIGYIPRDLAAALVYSNLVDKVRIRLKHVSIYDDWKKIAVDFDIFGPKDQKQYLRNPPRTKRQSARDDEDDEVDEDAEDASEPTERPRSSSGCLGCLMLMLFAVVAAGVARNYFKV